MKDKFVSTMKFLLKSVLFWSFLGATSVLAFSFLGGGIDYQKSDEIMKVIEKLQPEVTPLPPLDTVLYDKKLVEIANNPPQPKPKTITKKDKDGTVTTTIVPAVPRIDIWPVKTVYPNAGAILPFNRILAYYGNLYSKKMGVLGQYPEEEMLRRLDIEVKKWELADPATKVVPALHYIAVVAQGSAGQDGKYRFRMPGIEIDKVLKMAEKINAIVFLDIQVGFSNLQIEVPLLSKYLKMPNVHLGVDPEFSMKTGIKPGKVVGTLDATDINFTIEYLAKLVKENNLTPKILVIHRYTERMVTNYKLIKPLPEVQVVMHMDGWGGAAKKINTYQQFVYKQPVQFAGFKLFYRHDILTPGTTLMTPQDLLKLSPQPLYIQFQ